MKKLLFAILFLFTATSNLIYAQSSETIRQYIEKFKDLAIQEELRTGVPASITLAQGIHETGAGTSDLVVASNNHFGIKCKGDWKGETVSHDDDAKGECFRKYSDPFDSYRDHSDFLKNRPHYSALFTLDPTDYEGWAYGLKKAGYATNPKYPQILIKLIKDYNLNDYTLIALNKKPSSEAVWAKNSINSESSAKAMSEIVEAPKSQIRSYPAGVFTINNTKVLFVEKGTAFLKIAEEHNISLSRLFDFNDMTPEDIASSDQLIYLQRKRKTGEHEFHVVEEGETTRDVSQTEGIRLESLLNLNLLSQGMQPAAGAKLYLMDKASFMPQLSTGKQQNPQPQYTVNKEEVLPAETSNDFILHSVQPKETIYAISKKYSVDVEDLRKWNELQTTDLKIGQQLKINKSKTNAFYQTAR
jgi:flagellum-specific peptidoglycan hydrolase FlgJ